MRETEAVANARREMEICNACRYCEGFCAVFPAVELRRAFSAGDLSYLANLCHNCRGCYYACQYAPPHEWGINVPRTLATLRAESYAEYAWPKGFGQVFERNGTLVSLVTALAIAVVLILTMLVNTPDNLFAAHAVAPGAFFTVIPLWAMQVVGIASFGYALVALWMGARNFWKDAGPQDRPGIVALVIALWDVLTLKNLGGGGNGCNDNSERFSMRRRWLHHAMFYGFMLCFAATCTGFVYHSFLGWSAPYAFASAPVLLGTVGGVLLLIGTVGLFAMKLVDDPMPSVRRLLGGDVALLMLLALASLTGLVLLALRGTGGMGIALAVHLGFILALFLALPYSKMVHGVYRSAALLRRATERNMKPLGGE
ncbi:MAG: tricarballylate utilization 4Fe-4S protein TcuB [Acetobacteraceae bacterium]|nr:tricarballylate utilization 4Fe-4S protein TcuB [Acetobacteraceae bacterium]